MTIALDWNDTTPPSEFDYTDVRGHHIAAAERVTGETAAAS